MAETLGFTEVKIPLKNLKLWSDNPRFPKEYFHKNENELIDYIVSVPYYKIKTFAKEVVEDFDMPIFEKLAIFNGEGQNIVYEGNRRLTVYKLLLDPNLTSNEDIRSYFAQLKRSINIDENFKIDCVVSSDKREILRYVNRKHLNNNNEVAWGSMENSNAKVRWLDNPDKIDIFKSNLSVIIRNLNIPGDDKDKILGKGFVTTLFRILNTVTSAKYFNLVFDDDNNLISEDNQFLDKLEIIIYDILLKKTFNGKIFSRLDTESIDEYLRSITINTNFTSVIKEEKATVDSETKVDVEDFHPYINDDKIGNDKEEKSIEKLPESPVIKDASKGSSAAIIPERSNKVKGKSTARKRLIPKDCKLTINQNKINNIYRELRDDLILDDSIKSVPNSVGVLFRVFIEVSLDYYAEKKHGHFFKKDDTISGKIIWVVNKMTEAGHAKKIFANISVVGSSKMQHSYLSIEKFHQYVHSSTLEPSSSELKTKWDLLEPFIKTLWEDINKN
ncbi:hypothetical protein [Flavobacterium fluviale]|uniref:Uncharacterized protein n=1 Tax=Flavobacterium fluviale TaxID=2249356 RepID=A0A344LUZ6_9FLAO|nr:hypothetical protein [Flavobacterium fluviale]AXB57738.1 hypothetical protein HYN86_14485 [Flavobacterium fluviale]